MDDTPITPAFDVDNLDAAPADSAQDQAMADIELANSMNNLGSMPNNPIAETPAEPIAEPAPVEPVAAEAIAAPAAEQTINPVVETAPTSAPNPIQTTTPAPSTTSNVPGAQPNPGNKSRAGIIVLIIILLVAGLGIGGYFTYKAIKDLDKKTTDISKEDDKNKTSDPDKKSTKDVEDDDDDPDNKKEDDKKDDKKEDKKEDKKGSGGDSGQQNPGKKSDYTFQICSTPLYIKDPESVFGYVQTNDTCRDDDTNVGAVIIGGFPSKPSAGVQEIIDDEMEYFAMGGVALSYTGNIDYDTLGEGSREYLEFKEMRTVGNKTIIAFALKESFFDMVDGLEMTDDEAELFRLMKEGAKTMREYLFDVNTYYYEGSSSATSTQF